MLRHELSQKEWDRLRSHLPCRAKAPAQLVEWESNMRRFLHAVRWLLRTGAPWRDLPDELCDGKWNTVYVRYNRWSKKGWWQRVFEALRQPEAEAAAEAVMPDGTVARAHSSAAGAKKKSGR